MREYVRHHSPVKDTGIIKEAYFGDIKKVLSLGGAYLFDEESCNRFLGLAKKSGLNVRVIEDKPGCSGNKLKLFRVEVK